VRAPAKPRIKPGITPPTVPAAVSTTGGDCSPQARRSRGLLDLSILAAIGLAALLAYLPALHGQPLWDDDGHMTRSELRGADGLQRIWGDPGATQQYYPLAHSAFWLQHKLWGDTTLGYHVVNVALHAIAAFLLLLSLRKLEVPGAMLAAFVFALHPVHVESVAWISELKNTLSGVLVLASALVYLEFDERRGSKSYVAAMVLFALALLSKTVTATLPAALLVVIWWRRGRLRWQRDALPLVPFVVFGIAAGLTTAWVERTFIGARGGDFDLTLVERGLVAGRAIVFYLGKLAWPSPLVFVYPRWHVDGAVWWQYLYPIAVVALLGALWFWRAKTSAPLAALLFFCVALAPALGFVNVYPFRYSFVADHFQYLASIGIITLAAASATGFVTRRRIVPPAASEALLVLVVSLPLGLLTARQARQYINTATLFSATLEANPECWLCHDNLGVLRLEDGSRAGLEAAAAHFQAAARINPTDPNVHKNLGSTLVNLGRLEEAVAEERLAIRYAPWYAEAHGDLGSALQRLGRRDEAVEEYRRALQLKPDSPVVRANLAVILFDQGHADAAVAELQQGLQQAGDPATRTAAAFRNYVQVGNAYVYVGRHAEAAQAFTAALRLQPQSASTRRDLGHMLWRLGRYHEAAAELREVLRLAPDDALAHAWLGTTLHASGKLESALAEYERAFQLGVPTNAADFHNDMGVALARVGRQQDAATHFKEALRLKPDFEAARANLSKATGLR
jgi:Flp pilus assembly protein TadD